jgi:hypothetical protein
MVRASGEPQRVSAALTVLLAQDQAGWEGSGDGGVLRAVRVDGAAAVAVVLRSQHVVPVGRSAVAAIELIVARQARRPQDDAARGVARHVVGRRHDGVAAASTVEQVGPVRRDLAVAREQVVAREECALRATRVGVSPLTEDEAGVEAVAEAEITRGAAAEGRRHAVPGDDELAVVDEGDHRVGVPTLEPHARQDPLAANGHPEPGDVRGPAQGEVAERPVRNRVAVHGAADREPDTEHLQRDRRTGRTEDEPQEVLVRPADDASGAEGEVEARSRQLPGREHRTGVGLDRGRDVLRLDGVTRVDRQLHRATVLRRFDVGHVVGDERTGVGLVHGGRGVVGRGRQRRAGVLDPPESRLRTDLDLGTAHDRRQHRTETQTNLLASHRRRPPSCTIDSPAANRGQDLKRHFLEALSTN